MTREEAVQALVRFDRPLEALRAGIVGYPWDWEGPTLAVLKREHLIEALSRWQAGDLSDHEVENWADLVEVRDDLDHDPEDPVVADAVFNLANPLLHGPIQEVGPTLIQKLKA
jgi:hypothetical protein